MSTTTTIEPRIYVACLASYNAGTLHGAWIDCAGKTGDEIAEEVQTRVIATSREPFAEEWAIHDHEGLGDISEHESFDRVAELAEAVEEYGDAWLAYVETVGAHYADLEGFERAYRGEFDSLEDYAREYVDSIGLFDNVSETMEYYFDYASYGRDLDVTLTNGYVFDMNA